MQRLGQQAGSRTGLDGTGPVVVGVDPSDLGQEALRWAARFGAITGIPVRAVMWCDAAADLAAGGARPEDAARALARVITDAADGAVVEPVVERGDAVVVLLEHAADAALLVLGHPAGPVPAGSVAQQCLARARCPVLFVPG